jgi:propanediol dehydratase large subunit
VQAIAAVFEELELGKPTTDMMASVVAASGSEETQSYLPRDVSFISERSRRAAST